MSDAPSDLNDRGGKLWNDLGKLMDLDGPGRVLAEEACRLTDRLQRMAVILADDLDPLYLSEARQSQMALKHLMNELRQMQKLTTQSKVVSADSAVDNLLKSISEKASR